MFGTDEFVDVSDEAAKLGTRNTVFVIWSCRPVQPTIHAIPDHWGNPVQESGKLVLVAHTIQPKEVIDRVGRAMQQVLLSAHLWIVCEAEHGFESIEIIANQSDLFRMALLCTSLNICTALWDTRLTANPPVKAASNQRDCALSSSL
jgi:hypothetical protein